MSKNIKITKGFDIRLAGSAAATLSPEVHPETYVIKPTDFYGIGRQKLLVQQGDQVKAGTPLFFDKNDERIQYTSPVSGEIVEVNRGEKRKILEIKILADKENSYVSFNKYDQSGIESLSKEDALQQLLSSGAWANIIQRPYAIVAKPGDSPKAIFISGFDSHPLAPDYKVIFKEDETAFQAGLSILRKFTSGKVHLTVHADQPAMPMFSNAKGVQLNKISGPHPSGNVGVQIHHIDPINKGDIVWTVSVQGVICIGRLFTEGRYNTSKWIALCGSEIKNPKYYRVFAGASVNLLLKEQLKQNHVRVISGNVLTGERIAADGHMGYYHQQVTVIPEGDYQEFLGWILPSAKKLSFQRAFGLLSFLNPSSKEYVLDSNTHGEERAFVQTGVFEKVMPMDIYPMQLVKAILAKDYTEMEALGIYEVAEEDFALCEFVDVSKNDIQQIVREGLELMLNS
jgi:Na+-transporting NADH:ubiquinone oxidoreductase subunit A